MRPWANQPANSGAHERMRLFDLEDVVPVEPFPGGGPGRYVSHLDDCGLCGQPET